MTGQANFKPGGYHSATPYLIVQDAGSALDFYKTAFGATELLRMADEDGTVQHAEIKIGDSPVMIGGHREVALTGPHERDYLPPVSIYLFVEDAEATFSQALAAGAREKYPVKLQDYGVREGGLEDPFGMVWWIATQVEELPAEELAERARAAEINP